MAKRFDRQLERATDSTLIDPNWDAIIECVDMIRGGEAPVKAAVASIRKRYHNENPHVAHHALLVLEACMKNCGSKFHAEIATKDFMEDLKNLSLDSTPDKVKSKILELLQCWAMAFKNKPEYKIVVDTHNLMKLAGFEFPEVAEAEAMFVAESAPEWADGDECFRCRAAFGILTRKHHCRACGQIFCDKCSSKQSYLPQYGIEKQVRVCDGCFEKTPSGKSKPPSEVQPPASGQSASGKSDKPLPVDAKKTAEQRARELKQAEEDELNLALAISQSEAEAQEQERQRKLYQLYNGTDAFGTRSAPTETSNANEASAPTNNETFIYRGAASSKRETELAAVSNRESEVDPELARYLNRDYWQQRKNEQKNAAAAAESYGVERRKTPTPTAPPPSESSMSRHDATTDSGGAFSVASTTKQLDGDTTPTPQFGTADEEETAETMEFCRQLREQVTVMDNRIRSNIARNRSIVNDTAIQSLFIRLTEMHAQVMARMNKLEDRRNHFESLQDHLAHIQEARQAVNALREDYERRKQERAIEEQRLRQQQMQQKVDLMRQKKHELLLHQRHLALLRFQQQEQELQMRRMQAQQGGVQPPNYYGAEPGIAAGYAVPTTTTHIHSAVIQGVQPYYSDGGQQYVAQQYGYPTGASVDPNQQKQLAPPVIDQQAPQAVPQATCQVSQAVPQVPQTMPQGSQSVPQIQYPAQYISQEVVQDQKATPMISNVPVHSASNGSIACNGTSLSVVSSSEQVLGNTYGANAAQQPYMYQGMAQLPPQAMVQKVAATDYNHPQVVPQQYSAPPVVQYQQQQPYPTYQAANAAINQAAGYAPQGVAQLGVQDAYQQQYSNASGQYYQSATGAQPAVPSVMGYAEPSQPVQQQQQPAEGLLISFD